jgi:eukaryotic-like serine/threonine-protein kinase
MKAVTELGPIEILVTEVVDDFMSRLRTGDRPDVEKYAARHPAIAHLLRELLPALQVMDQSSLASSSNGQPRASGALAPGCLGDFYILRQVGQGGMGIVYEAEQISLVRRVALKVLPFASTLDAKQLQRFKNEAQAAAHLRHPNIVPVYTAGCERGVHYYAMQFIDGNSVAALIQELRQCGRQDPDSGKRGSGEGNAPLSTLGHARVTERSASNKEFFRTVARWGMQAAAALEHAHQCGIVHRDIKPANLLVDGEGNLWITDFGLARLRSDNGLTLTGDLLGTLRYMSPEQAQAGRNPLDHRSDVYSLGMTLYELVGLQPAFMGSDRQELLQQIATEEPRVLSRLNASVPEELEVILLKATAKRPDERYATAQEFADDFSRFLEDRPIRARRPSLVQRLKRRLRRHKTVALSVSISAAAALILAVVVLTVSNLRIAEEQALTRKALADAQASRLAAERHRALAEANFHKARTAVDKMLTEVSENYLADLPQTEHVRRALLEKALEFYQGFCKEQGDDPEVRFETGRAYGRVGMIYQKLGEPSPSENAYRRALELFEKLMADFPAEPRYRHEMAQQSFNLGTALRQDFGRPSKAEPYMRRAVGLLEKLTAEEPKGGYRQELAQAHHGLGYQLVDEGRLAEAEPCFRRALAEWDAVGGNGIGQAQSYNSLGLLLRVKGRLAEAEEAHRSAQALVRPPFPSQLHFSMQWELARSQAHLGIVLARRQRFADAAAAVRDAIAARTRLVQESHGSRTARQELALTYLTLGWIAEMSGHTADAETPYREALAHEEKLHADFPLRPDSASRLGRVHVALGQVLHELGRRAEAEESFRSAGRAFEDGLNRSPANPEINFHYARLLAVCPLESCRDPNRAVALATKAVTAQSASAVYQSTLGMAHYRARNWKAARMALQKATEQAGGDIPAAHFFLAMTHWQLGAEEQARRVFEQGNAEAFGNSTLATRRCRAEAAALLGAQ